MLDYKKMHKTMKRAMKKFEKRNIKPLQGLYTESAGYGCFVGQLFTRKELRAARADTLHSIVDWESFPLQLLLERYTFNKCLTSDDLQKLGELEKLHDDAICMKKDLKETLEKWFAKHTSQDGNSVRGTDAV